MPDKSLRCRTFSSTWTIGSVALAVIGSCLLTAAPSRADVSLSPLFGDHMVLQRDITVPIWGTASPGEKVTVTAGSDTVSTTADANGAWSVKLAKLQASTTPIDVTIAGKNTITFHDVLVGDVWICSGQSNMQFGIAGDNVGKDTIAAANEPQIRLFTVPPVTARTPQASLGAPQSFVPLEGSWQVCTPESLQEDGNWNGFSAVGYYFGHDIQQFTKQPIGLIATDWGGTPAQAWTSLEALQSSPALAGYVNNALDYQKNYDQMVQNYNNVTLPAYQKWLTDVDAPYQQALKDWPAQVKTAQDNNQPLPLKPVETPVMRRPASPDQSAGFATDLYNGMIAPLIPYAIKGAIWYQGEANAGQGAQYATLFPTMIGDWRKRWGEGDFPFFWVQLANYMGRSADPSDTGWAALREAQRTTLSLPNTGMAVTIDIGAGKDIHPKDKWDVGYRLSLAAEHVAYGADIVCSGPMYKSLAVDGSQARLSFDDIGGGLTIGTQPAHFKPTTDDPLSTTALQGFTIAGDDNKFYWADATIDGSTVVVSSPSVPKPVSVRYAWGDNPAANLYNKEGLPASPFRTDKLPIGENLPKPTAPAQAAAPAPTLQPAVPQPAK